MPAILANASKFRITTDYPTDVIGYQKEITQTIPHSPDFSSATTITIPHGLSFVPLCTGVYTDDSFTKTFDFGSSPMFNNPDFGGQWGQRIVSVVESDATNVYITVFNGDTSRSMTFRVVGFAPSDYTGSAAATNTGFSNFLFNSDDNYLKLFSKGKTSIVVPNTGVNTPAIITHALGNVPHALLWTTMNGTTRQAGLENYIGVGGVDVEAYVTTATATVNMSGFTTTTVDVHWRIYLDN